ncbi:MAG: hypothetical protein LBH92_01955 [Bacteroidales bacterium]|jgi:hypothetical protein|nr:hypothetical protein [Bacteroidales bacterium]
MEPRIDGFGDGPFVFATPNFVSALRYITPHKNILCFGIIAGKAVLIERNKGAFQKAYKNISGIVYELPGNTFKLTKLSHGTYYLSQERVQVARKIEITDVWQKLLQAKEKGLLDMYEYPYLPENYTINYKSGFEKIIRKFLIKTSKLQQFYRNFCKKHDMN